MSDHFKHSTALMIETITCILNLMLVHGYIPVSFLEATVVPIPKNCKLDCSLSSNYRAITLSCIFGKILDKALLNMQNNVFNTGNLQFGFKSSSSTVMCSSMVTETIEYYVSNNSLVYLLIIDASSFR